MPERLPGVGRQRRVLAGEQLPDLRKLRVDLHQLPQGANAFRQEQVERRLAGAIADVGTLIGGEQGLNGINVAARLCPDAHCLEVEGNHREAPTGEDDCGMDAPCHLERVTGAPA